MTVIDGVFRLGRACDKQTRDAFQSSWLTGVRLWAATTLQSLWWEIEGRSRTREINVSSSPESQLRWLNLPHIGTKVNITTDFQDTSWSVIREFRPWERKGHKLKRKRLGKSALSAENGRDCGTGWQLVYGQTMRTEMRCMTRSMTDMEHICFIQSQSINQSLVSDNVVDIETRKLYAGPVPTCRAVRPSVWPLTSWTVDRHESYSCSGEHSGQFCFFFCTLYLSSYKTYDMDRWTAEPWASIIGWTGGHVPPTFWSRGT